MGYSTQIAIPLLLFAAFSIPRVEGWPIQGSRLTNSSIMDSFMPAFMSDIAQSGVFTGNQLEDMQAISNTLVNSIEEMVASGKSSSSMLQALDMAFASSVAEIAIADTGGANLAAKTSAIANAMSNALLQTTGSANSAFINEISQLVSMYLQHNADETENPSARAGGFADTSMPIGEFERMMVK